jgi:hypothetical protein
MSTLRALSVDPPKRQSALVRPLDSPERYQFDKVACLDSFLARLTTPFSLTFVT